MLTERQFRVMASVGFGVRKTWVRLMALSLTGYMTTDTFLISPRLSFIMCKPGQ